MVSPRPADKARMLLYKAGGQVPKEDLKAGVAPVVVEVKTATGSGFSFFSFSPSCFWNPFSVSRTECLSHCKMFRICVVCVFSHIDTVCVINSNSKHGWHVSHNIKIFLVGLRICTNGDNIKKTMWPQS